MEQFYSVAEVSSLLRISKDATRKLFRDQPGVIRLSRKLRPRMRIPESVLHTVITGMGYVGAANGNEHREETGRGSARP
jgi:hypothetical protein